MSGILYVAKTVAARSLLDWILFPGLEGARAQPADEKTWIQVLVMAEFRCLRWALGGSGKGEASPCPAPSARWCSSTACSFSSCPMVNSLGCPQRPVSPGRTISAARALGGTRLVPRNRRALIQAVGLGPPLGGEGRTAAAPALWPGC